MSSYDEQAQQLRELTCKLERISADSHWARRASGVRGALLRYLTGLEQGVRIYSEKTMVEYAAYAEFVLLKAAREL